MRELGKVLDRLNLIVERLEQGLISPEDPSSMEWLCKQMMSVIEGLVLQQTTEDEKIRLVELYRRYEKLSKVFHTLSLRSVN